MPVTTRLEPISPERATELFEMINDAHKDEKKAIALDENGFATGVVDVDDAREEHLLGDLDVHA